MSTYLRYLAGGLIVLLVQWLVLGRIGLWGATPDAVLLFVAWTGLRLGRRPGALAGFLAGTLMDALYDTWGIHMFAKTLTGFLLGLFRARERESLHVLPRQAFAGGFVIALVHNGIAVTLLALATGTSSPFMVTALWIGASLYTAFLGFLA
ncbi:MAG: rod shape-determining protein MreD, partial [Bacteroidetes bacterium]